MAVTEFTPSSLGEETRINPSALLDVISTSVTTQPYFAGVYPIRNYLVAGEKYLIPGSFARMYNDRVLQGGCDIDKRSQKSDLFLNIADASGTKVFKVESSFPSAYVDKTSDSIMKVDDVFKIKVTESFTGLWYLNCLGRKGILVRPGDVFEVPFNYFEGLFQTPRRWTPRPNFYLEDALILIAAGVLELYTTSAVAIQASEATGGFDAWDGTSSAATTLAIPATIVPVV